MGVQSLQIFSEPFIFRLKSLKLWVPADNRLFTHFQLDSKIRFYTFL